MSIDDKHGHTARKRVVIEGASPTIDGGKWPAKRIVGDRVRVETRLVADGHDVVDGVVQYRKRGGEWKAALLEDIGNDVFAGEFTVDELGYWEFTFVAWVDEYATWCHALEKRLEAEVVTDVDMLIGAQLLEAYAKRTRGKNRKTLMAAAKAAADSSTTPEARAKAALSESLAEIARNFPDMDKATEHEGALPISVHPPQARFSAWYEFFPRSVGQAGEHGTLRDAADHLDYVAGLGFDVVYLPPIHPIGETHRKGKNNTLDAEEDDPGSPWAVGGAGGGHKAVHPDLGTLEDFDAFVTRANELGLNVALDIAFQASPDHPWVSDHPTWFAQRPDGTIQYAENPPKKYQDIYPINFDSDAWLALWEELYSVFAFWIEHGVTIFRVDNPQTKSVRFWAWCLDRLYSEHPEVIFLAEAFTKPSLMYALAKRGFTQSYTYFTWRQGKWEFEEYLRELTSTPVADFFGPNFWPNTPDILPEHLQSGLRSSFIGRLVLAATLTSNYGIYGPAFELMEHVARPGSGEYIDNEKYELKDWDLDGRDNLRHVIRRINRIRRGNRALHDNRSLTFHRADNDSIIIYSKTNADQSNVILVVVNLDWHNRQTSWVHLDMHALGLEGEPYEVHDLISDARYTWHGADNYVDLDPHLLPAHIFRIRVISGQ
jgi:starch synthase (maltosyl-transferring)